MVQLLLGVLIITIYVLIVSIKHERLPMSISETWYMGGKHWFTAALFVGSVWIMWGMLELSEGSNFQFLSFLTGAGIGFVGAAPEFLEKDVAKIHYTAAIVLFIASQLWVLTIATPWTLILWLLFPLWYKKLNRMLWCEVTCIVTLCLSLFFI